MFPRIDPGVLDARTLKPNDIAGACSLATQQTCVEGVSGGCDAGAGGSLGLGLLAGVHFCTGGLHKLLSRRARALATRDS